MKDLINYNSYENIFKYTSNLPAFIKTSIAHTIPAILRANLHYRKLPTNLTLFVTQQCNLKCKHCFIMSSNENVVDVKKEMTLSNYQKMFRKIVGSVCHIKITGGEPTLRPELADIILAASKDGGVKLVSIFTNGTMTEKLISDLKNVIKKTGVNLNVQVSIYGDEQIHDHITGTKGAYQATIKTMEALSEVRFNYPHRILRLSVATGFFKDNEHAIQDVVDLVNTFGFEHVISFPRSSRIHTFGIGNEWKSPYYPQDYYFWEHDEINTKIKTIGKILWRDKNISLFKKSNKIILETMLEIIKNKKSVANCYFGKADLIIYSNGDVSRCEMLKSITNLAMYDYNIPLLFKSDQYKSYLNNTNTCWCLHDCSIGLSMIYEAKIFQKLFI